MRGHEDESTVDGDRREALAMLIEQAASIVDAAGEGSSERAQAFAVAAHLLPELPAVGSASARLLALAAAVRRGGRRSVRSLADGARALLLLGLDTGVQVELPTLTAGAVALYASTTAPFDRRAVIRGRTVRASDGDWGFGTGGPVLQAPGTEIAAFLLGVSDTPPQPLSPQ